MPDPTEVKPVAPSIQAWLQQGEQLYAAALSEYRSLEAQLDDLERKLAAKQNEVNQIAGVVGKPPIESGRRLSAELVTGQIIEVPERIGPQQGQSNASIARALTGKFGR